MTREVMRYKLNKLRMMLNDGEHGEEQGILVDIIKELDKAENKGEEYRKGWHDAINKALDEAYDIDVDGECFTVVQEETLLGLGMASEIPSENKGEWIVFDHGMGHVYLMCPFCGCFNGSSYKNFCLNCGADMRKGGE